MRLLILLFILTIAPWSLDRAEARTWTSHTGGYTLEADVVAMNETTVILKKPKGQLVAVELEELSDADRAYVASKEASDEVKKSVDQMQTWTADDGLKVRGQVLAYGRKELSIARQLGKVIVNGTPFAKLEPIQQKVVLRILNRLEGQPFEDERDLTAWARRLGGKTQSYPLEGVLMRLESGDEIAIPFFLFSEQDRAHLQPGWEGWLAQEANDQARQREELMMRSEAMRYQENQELEVQRQQIEILKLNLLAAATGVTSIWEVALQPAIGVYGRPTTVVVSARDSQTASQMVMSQYPGYRVFAVRRLNR